MPDLVTAVQGRLTELRDQMCSPLEATQRREAWMTFQRVQGQWAELTRSALHDAYRNFSTQTAAAASQAGEGFFLAAIDAATAAGPAEPLAEDELRRRADAMRGLFQSALLRWLKDDNSAATIRDLTDVCEQLVPITDAEHARRLFWVAAGTLDALAKGAFEASKPLKQALAKVEQEIKRLAEGGDAAFRSDPPLELTRQLLYFVAHAPTDHGRIGEIREVFGLGQYLPSESELAHARGSLSGRNKALLSTVAAAIKEDLLRVKDALDLHLRGGPHVPTRRGFGHSRGHAGLSHAGTALR